MAAQLLAYTFARHALCHRFTLHSLHLKLMLNRIPLYVMLLCPLKKPFSLGLHLILLVTVLRTQSCIRTYVCSMLYAYTV